MMKKSYLVLFLVSLVGFLAFGLNGEQEEIDFLFFLPNSGNQFVNEEKAMIQLDNAAHYLKTRSLGPGSISVHGYTAAVANDIDPVNLSRERALHVINELKKRGLGGDLFSEPAANGPVDLWGSSPDEGSLSLNRRVMIVYNNTILNPSAMRTVFTWEKTPGTNKLPEKSQQKTTAAETGSQCPWWIIPLLLIGFALIAAVLFFAARRKKSTAAVIPAADVTPAAHAPTDPPVENIYIITEEEIRNYAYKLYQLRKGQNEDAVQDWHRSIFDLTTYYEGQGYWVMLYWELEV